MSVPGMQALHMLLLLQEKDLFTPTLPPSAIGIEAMMATAFQEACNGVLHVCQQTVHPDWHTNYVEIHSMEVPRYRSQDNLFPNNCGEEYGLSRELISFDVPQQRRHVCEGGEHQQLIETFGEEGWWLQAVVIDLIDFRGAKQCVNVHLKLADTRRNPRYDHPFPDFVPVDNYVYLTIKANGEHYCERFTIGCKVEHVQALSTGRQLSEGKSIFQRPLTSQACGSIDSVMGRGSEQQLLQDLPQLGAFLNWFAADNARKQ